ncbi:glycosyltransferase family 4 protein [Spiribacter salinus]|uniref:glycosyltransferase family 4 protein n=1 Tax=Spiribacter salinus TaxID=1335746 RepID=UPI001C938B63|nr:glycosyltransferase family 4 protein [Spiribacter salinus]
MEQRKKLNFISKGVKRFVAVLISRSSRVYAVGEAGVDSYEEYGVPIKLLKSLPYTKDFSVYQSKKKEYGKKVIVATARLVPSKKIDQLIRVFSDISGDFPSWSLQIIGDGKMRKQLEWSVPESLRGRISFHGFAGPEMQSEIYAGADIFVLPSIRDGWGMVIVEAMAAGLPVITTHGVVAGRDLVRDGENGFLVPVGQDEPLSASLRKAMAGGLDLKKMGENARGSASRYDVEKVADDLVADILTGWCCRE